MNRDQFSNGLRILRSIDAHELGNPEWWLEFRTDPYKFFIRADDETADLIWSVMLRRGAAEAAADVARQLHRIDQILAGHLVVDAEREHANTPPHERPDWPLPSFDARDWAKAFLDAYERSADGTFLTDDTMIGWFSNALMRGFDEHAARSAVKEPPGTQTVTFLDHNL